MSRVKKWLKERYDSAEHGGVVVDRVSIAISEYDHYLLAKTADTLGMSKAALAGELLREVLREWYEWTEQDFQEMREQGVPEYAIEEERRGHEQALRKSYREWREQGKPSRMGEEPVHDRSARRERLLRAEGVEEPLIRELQKMGPDGEFHSVPRDEVRQ